MSVPAGCPVRAHMLSEAVFANRGFKSAAAGGRRQQSDTSGGERSGAESCSRTSADEPSHTAAEPAPCWAHGVRRVKLGRAALLASPP